MSSKELLSHARRSESYSALKNMIAVAATEEPVVATPAAFDRDPMLLNVRNGTLNLETGQLQPHRRADMITRLTPLDYDEKARCPAFIGFLDKVFQGDGELTAYLQRAIGYTLTGDTSEQVLFILMGRGANGKSTLLECLRTVLGEYAMQTPVQTILASRGDKPSNDLARLPGSRLVTAVEAGLDSELDQTLVKRLVGEDTISARFYTVNPLNSSPNSNYGSRRTIRLECEVATMPSGGGSKPSRSDTRFRRHSAIAPSDANLHARPRGSWPGR